MIGLVSEDSQLHYLCRAALTELGHADLLLEIPGPPVGVDQPDILVLDWSPELQVPEALSGNPGARRLYVVEHGQIERLAIAMFELNLGNRAKDRLVLRPDSIENCIAQASHEIRLRSEEKDISVTLRLRDIPASLCFDADFALTPIRWSKCC